MVYVTLCDDMSGMVSGTQVREKLDESIALSWIERDSWGMDVDTLDLIPQAAPRVEHHGAGSEVAP